MTVTVISFWLPMIWALAVAIYWRFLWKEPVNHWGICLLVFAVNFFFFAWSCIIFLIVMIFKSGILKKLMNTDEKDEPTK